MTILKILAKMAAEKYYCKYYLGRAGNHAVAAATRLALFFFYTNIKLHSRSSPCGNHIYNFKTIMTEKKGKTVWQILWWFQQWKH